MNDNEAIEFLKGKYPSWGCDEDEYENAITAIQALEEIQAYRAIGTIDEFKALKEKQIPKKPRVEYHCGLENRCPTCNCEVSDIEYREWSCKCGQKLDWQ